MTDVAVVRDTARVWSWRWLLAALIGLAIGVAIAAASHLWALDEMRDANKRAAMAAQRAEELDEIIRSNRARIEQLEGAYLAATGQSPPAPPVTTTTSPARRSTATARPRSGSPTTTGPQPSSPPPAGGGPGTTTTTSSTTTTTRPPTTTTTALACVRGVCI